MCETVRQKLGHTKIHRYLRAGNCCARNEWILGIDKVRSRDLKALHRVTGRFCTPVGRHWRTSWTNRRYSQCPRFDFPSLHVLNFKDAFRYGRNIPQDCMLQNFQLRGVHKLRLQYKVGTLNLFL